MALHRRGCRVTASDVSAAMVDQCRARVAAAGLTLPVLQCAWSDLGRRFGAEFDAVLCTGNSLAHTPTPTARRRALAGFAEILVDTGTLILDAQDWELLHRRGSHRDDDPLVVADEGIRCTRHFDWRVPERFGDPITLELTLTFSDDQGEWARSHLVTFCPFTTDELVGDLEAGGFEAVTVVQNPGDDRQAVIARMPRPPSDLPTGRQATT